MRVLVTGAGGFIGGRVVAALEREGIATRALVRRAGALQGTRHVEEVIGDMTDEASLDRAVAGCDAVIHLASRLMDQADSEAVNIGGATRLVAACRRANCLRIVNVSTQSVKIPEQGTYARTKAAADDVLMSSGLQVTTVYPSVVYAAQLAGVFGVLSKVVRGLPIVPVLGDGRWHSAPVDVDDVASALVKCVQQPISIGRQYDLGGSEMLTFDELLDRIGEACGVGARPKVHIPRGMALLAARVLAMLFRHPPITISNVLGSTQDTLIDIAPAQRDLGFAPRKLAAGLADAFPDGAAARPVLLTAEAKRMTRYLTGEAATPETIKRYLAGHQELFSNAADSVTWFTRRQPWSYRFLEAAASIWGPAPGLRQRTLLMTAILEAQPQYADHFLPRETGLLAAVWTLGWAGVFAGVRALIGLPLYLFLRPST